MYYYPLVVIMRNCSFKLQRYFAAAPKFTTTLINKGNIKAGQAAWNNDYLIISWPKTRIINRFNEL